MKTLLIFYLIFVALVALVLSYLVLKLKVKRPLRFLLITLLIISSPVLLSYVFVTYLAPIPEVEIPSVLGKTETEAVKLLRSNRLRGRVETRYSTEESETVSLQRPEAGRLVKAGRTVFLVIGHPKKFELPKPGEVSPEAPFIPEL